MKNFLNVAAAFLLCALVSSTGLAWAQEEASPQGRWEGQIRIPGQPLEVIVDLVRGDGDEWRGEIDIPVQGGKDFRLANVKVDGLQVSFSMQGVPGNPSFRGKLSKNGENISGDFSQGSAQFPFVLSRSDESPDVAPGRLPLRSPTACPVKGWKAFGSGRLIPARLRCGCFSKFQNRRTVV